MREFQKPLFTHQRVKTKKSVKKKMKINKKRYISEKTKRFVRKRDKGRCVECGSIKNLEFDHVIPYSKGGKNTANNLRLRCRKCNRIKYNKTNRDYDFFENELCLICLNYPCVKVNNRYILNEACQTCENKKNFNRDPSKALWVRDYNKNLIIIDLAAKY